MIISNVEYSLNDRKYKQHLESEDINKLIEWVQNTKKNGAEITFVECFNEQGDPIAFITKPGDDLT